MNVRGEDNQAHKGNNVLCFIMLNYNYVVIFNFCICDKNWQVR